MVTDVWLTWIENGFGSSSLPSVTMRYKEENTNKRSLFTLRCWLVKTVQAGEQQKTSKWYYKHAFVNYLQTYFNFRLKKLNVSRLLTKRNSSVSFSLMVRIL